MYEPKIVLKSTYKNYIYAITFNGVWYCAYVVIPCRSHPLYHVPCTDIDIDCHGGLTFSDYHPLLDHQWAIGWDYGHIGDYAPVFNDYRDEMENDFGIPLHHWTPEEIELECHNVIDQIINKTRSK